VYRLSGKCAHGEPLVDSTGAVRNCSVSMPCPIGNDCIHTPTANYCCPAPGIHTTHNNGTMIVVMFCSMPPGVGEVCAVDRVGTGQQRRQVWYFNKLSVSCEPMTFEGCGAHTLNMFDSRDDCMAQCATSVCAHGRPQLNAGGLSIETCSSNKQCHKGD
jgi:hypothetical protein